MFKFSRCSRSPASFLKPDAGDPNSQQWDGANEVRQLISRPLSRPSPTANLAGNWKGDPLIRKVCGLKFTPIKRVVPSCRHEPARVTAMMKRVMTANTFGIGYKHTQRGTLIVTVTLGIAALFLGLGFAFATIKALWLSVPILCVCAWLFSSLTIEIGERELRWRFGPGLIRKRVLLTEIVAAEPIKTNFLAGWGIHWTRYGWLYNVSGFDAVVVTLRSGKCFALGTDESQALVARLTEVIQQNQAVGFKA